MAVVGLCVRFYRNTKTKILKKAIHDDGYAPFRERNQITDYSLNRT